MANLRINDDSVARFRQKPRGTIPQDTHAGQQPPGAPAPDRHYDETRAAVESNVDQQRAQAAAAHDQSKPSVTPQAPPFMVHAAKVTPVRHPGSR